MSTPPIRLERAPPFAQLVLDRPERLNAIDRAMWDAIPARVAEIESDREIKVLLVSGADSRAFAAGAHIAEFPALIENGGAADYAAAMERATDALAALTKPSIAVIEGVCVGGGVSLALCCDVRFAAMGSRFGVTPARLGITYPLGDTRRLIAAVGLSAARDLLMTGRIIDADAALELGLIDRVFPADALWSEARAYAEHLAGLSQYSIRAAKAIIAEILAGATTETALSRRLFVEAFANADLAEGATAFLEKRPPKFTFS